MQKLNQFVVSLSLGLALLGNGCAENHAGRTAGEAVDDGAITYRVESALRDDAVYKFPDVKVATFKRTVQLSGFVTGMEQKAKAGDIAKTVEGVKEVENNITVKP
jgi:hyperosmotically inducible protein